MAKVFLTCMEESVARELTSVLAIEKHRIERRPPDSRIDDLLDADIVFTGDDARQYVPLLRGVRQKRPALPFIVVTKTPRYIQVAGRVGGGRKRLLLSAVRIAADPLAYGICPPAGLERKRNCRKPPNGSGRVEIHVYISG